MSSSASSKTEAYVSWLAHAPLIDCGCGSSFGAADERAGDAGEGDADRRLDDLGGRGGLILCVGLGWGEGSGG